MLLPVVLLTNLNDIGCYMLAEHVQKQVCLLESPVARISEDGAFTVPAQFRRHIGGKDDHLIRRQYLPRESATQFFFAAFDLCMSVYAVSVLLKQALS